MGRGRRELSGLMLLFCLDGDMGYTGVCICQKCIEWYDEDLCILLYAYFTSKEKKRAVNKYWTLVNSFCA